MMKCHSIKVLKSHKFCYVVFKLFFVVGQNGQANDVKNMTVAPGSGIDLEFDSDGRYFFLAAAAILCVAFSHVSVVIGNDMLEKLLIQLLH